MSHSPLFSVVLATYNRGRHITPTILSVLRQTFADFELIVVGDGCDDDTEQAVRSFGSDKISWRDLKQNSGSQSVPNNEGIGRSRGRWICYIGHDDIWAPDHLTRLRDVIAGDSAADFVVSGCIYYGPDGSEVYYVTGLFEASDAAFRHFFPPASIAHRRDVPDRIGNWPDPRAITLPVDADFLLRAAHAGLRFRSTGRISVHKFAGGHRYLSYLRPTSSEQIAMLRSLERDEEGRHDRIIEIAKRQGLFMGICYGEHSHLDKGYWHEWNRKNKGLSRPQLRPFSGAAVIVQSDEPRGLDWHGLETGRRPFRWSGPNPRPKILIPFTGGWVRIAIRLHCPPPAELSVFVEDRKATHKVEIGPDGACSIVFLAQLSRSDDTILTLHAPVSCAIEPSRDSRRLGIAVSDIVLEPP
jgi:glycosyltransferase involved in cell wall biosynthesis